MDRRGGCCIAKYGVVGYDISGVDRIMLKFRPIAPKPTTGTSRSSPEMTETSPKSGRGKKRLNGSNKRCNNSNNNRKRKVLAEEKPAAAVVTLPLLPGTPTPKKESPAADEISPRNTKNLPAWLSFGGDGRDVAAVDPTVGSCVTVEGVTDTWVDGDGLGSTDGERRMNLESDTCPGFISDGFGRVTWTNGEYRKMARGGDGGGGGEVVVWLMVKDKVAVTAAMAKSAAVTCRVTVRNQRERSSVMTVPCDVWRMDGGGFAWRLDVTAALSLGR